jgi:arylsulfatase A-like enzyme
VKQPNVIFILSDDLSFADIGCYGQKQILTPNVDRLAAEGMRFTQAYAGASICAPSRSCLITSKHLGHTRVREHGQKLEDGSYQESLRPEDATFGNVMKKAGYTTAAIGKWGVGIPGTLGVPYLRGFDYSYGFYDQIRAHSFYPEYVWRNDRPVILEGNAGFDMTRLYKSSSRRWSDEDDDENRNIYDGSGKLIPQGVADPAKAQNTYDLFEAEALEFIEKQAEQPFFLYLAFQNPHGPLVVPELTPYKDAEWPSQRHKEWGAIITRMDTGIGRILDLLDSKGIADDTVVFFASDNGYSCWGYFGMGRNEEVEFFDNKGPFRGSKFTLDGEAGIRVPLVARWPGRIEPGSETDQVVAFWDVLPTLAELAGAEVTPDTDGISFLPTLTGGDQPQHDYFYWEQNHQQAARQGTWKAFREHPDQPIQLYELVHDIGESKDLAADHSDVVARFREIFSEAHTDSDVFTNPGESEASHRSKLKGLPSNAYRADNPYHLKWIEDFE